MVKIDRKGWTRNMASEVETLLINLVNDILGVKEAHGCSLEGYDFKIIFKLGNDNVYLEFSPDGYSVSVFESIGRPFLGMWFSSHKKEPMPSEVKSKISKEFPKTDLSEPRNEKSTYWFGVTEEDLRNAVSN